MSKVYIFLANGFEEIEGLTVIDMLRRADVDIASVSISDTLQVTGSHNIKVQADIGLGDVNYDDGCMFVLPGGLPGTTNLGECAVLTQLLKQAAKDGKYIAAICAAPSVPGKLGLLKGRRATCYPGFENTLDGAIPQTDTVVVDGHFITSRGMGTAIEFAAQIIAVLKDSKTAQDLKASIMFNY